MEYNGNELVGCSNANGLNVKSKIEQAFKIIGKLLEQKIIEKDLTVKEFMKLVNDIAEII